MFDNISLSGGRAHFRGLVWMQSDKVYYYLLNSTVLCFPTTPKPKGTTASQNFKVL